MGKKVTERRTAPSVNKLNREQVFCAVLTGLIARPNGHITPTAMRRLATEYTDALLGAK